MNNIYEIIGNLLAAIVVGLLAYVAPKAKAWFEANASQATQERRSRCSTTLTPAVSSAAGLCSSS